jgi:hypothetical protein
MNVYYLPEGFTKDETGSDKTISTVVSVSAPSEGN